MPQPEPCPRCKSSRLTVVYFDAEGQPIGGHLHCPDCGPRHAEQLRPTGERVDRVDLLERKAS